MPVRRCSGTQSVRRAALGVILTATAGFAALLPPAMAAADADGPAQPPALCLTLADQGRPLPPGGRLNAAADELVMLKKYDAATQIYRASLQRFGTDGCAARGLAWIARQPDPKGSWASRAKTGWDEFYTNWVGPAVGLVLPFAAILIFLLVLSRLLTAVVVFPAAPAWSDPSRRCTWGLGVGLCVAAAAAIVLMPRLAGPAVEGLALLPLLGAGCALVLAVKILAVLRRPRGSTPRNGALDYSAGVLLIALLLVNAVLDPAWLVVIAETAVLSAVAGVLMVAGARGLPLRLQVDVRGADGVAVANDSAYLVARLLELGSGRPEGLEVPEKTDVTALPEEALSTLPEGRVAVVFFQLLRVLTPAVPWRGTVTLTDSDSAVVELSRNGRPMAGSPLLVTRRSMDLPDLPADDKGDRTELVQARGRTELLTAAAAYFLVTLGQVHPELRRGLCGASRWESVSGQTLASTAPYVAEPALRLRLLRSAVDVDPQNLLARTALVSTEHSGACLADELARGAELDVLRTAAVEQVVPGAGQPAVDVAMAGYEALEIRILFNLAVSQLNAFHLYSCWAYWSGAERAVHTLLSRLVRIGSGQESRRELAEFSRLLRPVVYFLWLGVRDTRPPGPWPAPGWDAVAAEAEAATLGWADVPEASRRFARYAHACALASKTVPAPEDLDDALDHLAVALADSRHRAGAWSDPALAVFRRPDTAVDTRRRFQAIVGQPTATSILALEPFAPYATGLRGYGLRTPPDLAGLSPRLVASALTVDPRLADRWRALARMAVHPLGATATEHRCSHLMLLIRLGIESREQLGEQLLLDGADALFPRLLEAAKAADFIPTPPDTVDVWRRRWEAGPPPA